MSVFDPLSPQAVVRAAEAFSGLRFDGSLVPYNSYINRVYELERADGGGGLVAKFYRPGRWSAEALREHFYRPCVRMFGYDNVWGKVLFGIYERVLRKGRLSDAFIGSVARDAGGGMSIQERILWSVFAGDAPYRTIARDAVAPRSIAEILKNLLRR